ncbi:Heme-thiolate peroxidase [Mycena kentingensis (nom. inval.)]|nr:Heme-thiolate peroxidase [Mycena kentingensis (nom. inval.)]
MALSKVFFLYIVVWDACLTLINLILPKRRVGNVVAQGKPGHGGIWPEYVAPSPTDSRCACPALNAMANHGILPRNGRNIKFPDMGDKIHDAFNFGKTFCRFVPAFAADMLKKDYHNASSRVLGEISLHNGIEHDASLTREDAKFDPDQGKPYLPFIDALLGSATGKDANGSILTIPDLQRYSARRRVDAQAKNPDFSLAKQHKMFGSSNSSTMLTIFGGRVADLKVMLREERFPEGWEPRVRSRMGLTFLVFNMTVFKVEKGIEKYQTEIEAEGAPEAVPEKSLDIEL